MNIYETLKRDHDIMRQMLNDLVNLDEAKPDERNNLLHSIRQELISHARAEEAILYDCMQDVGTADHAVFHGYEEHMEGEQILMGLMVREKFDADWKKAARKLQKAVTHHLDEEEERIFEAARQMFTSEEAQMMGEEFEKLKPQIETENPVRNAVDAVATLMPPRIAAMIRNRGMEEKIVQNSRKPLN